MSCPKKCTEGDTLIAGPELPNGARPFVRHQADCKVVSGIMRPLAEGEPIYGNCFYLKQHGESSVYDVEEVAIPETTGKGPAKVNSEKFRDGWDRIFGDVGTAEA